MTNASQQNLDLLNNQNVRYFSADNESKFCLNQVCPPRSKLSFLLRNHIKVFGFQTRPGLFVDSLVDGWAVIFFFGISSRFFGSNETRPLYGVPCRWVGCRFLLRNLIRIFRFQTRPLCWFACRWVGCNFLLWFRGGSRIFFRRGCTRLLLYFNTDKPHSFFCRILVVLENRRSSRGGGGGAHPLHPPPRSRSSGSTPGLRWWVTFRWVGRSFLLRNRIKVLRFHSRRLSWGPVVDRWAVFSFFGIILRSLGSTAGVFAESVVAG